MTTLKNKLNKLSPTHRKKINKRTKELIAEKMTLRDLRGEPSSIIFRL